MKVLFDHQIFNFVYGGASKYFAMLLANMPQGSWQTTCLLPVNEYARSLHLFKTYPYVFRGQMRIVDYINRPYTRWRLSRGHYDVFHQTNFGTYCLKELKDKPMVTTYHDANYSTFNPQPELVELQRLSLQRADAVVAVSRNTKKDLLELFNIDERKVHVVYHGIEQPDLSRLGQRLFDFPYLLYVGQRAPYKNFTRFVRAFAAIAHRVPDVKVVCTFFDFSSSERQLMQSLGLNDRFVHISADERQMLQLYHDAVAFVYPSLYEGFGMPILEAWCCQCPVVLSRASCFPEIAAEAGLYFDPNSEEEMSVALLRIIDDSTLHDELIRRGTERVKLFSWKQCADRHVDIYKSLI